MDGIVSRYKGAGGVLVFVVYRSSSTRCCKGPPCSRRGPFRLDSE